MKVVDLLNELGQYPGAADVTVNAKAKTVGDLFTVKLPKPAKPIPEDTEPADVTE